MFRIAVLLVGLGAVAPLILLTCRTIGLSSVVCAVVIVAVCSAGLPIAYRLLPERLGGHRRDRLLFGFWFVLSVFVCYRVACLGVFMGDVDRSSYAIAPHLRELSDPVLAKPFFVKHNCFTCYILAAHLADNNVENIYDASKYRDAQDKTVIHRTIGDKLNIDRYQYPPPFLLMPKALWAVSRDFFEARTYGYVLNLVVFGLTAVVLAVWLGGRGFGAHWFLWPVVLAAPITLSTLQIGNVHFLILCISILALPAFETNRNALGAALLGFAIVSKIFPGVLLLYLLTRRRYRAVIATGVAMALFCLAALMIWGVGPYRAFVDYQVPRLISGEAFFFAWEHVGAMTSNSSVVGALFKLDKLGWLGGVNPRSVAGFVTWGYTATLVAATVFAGWRIGRTTAGTPSPPSDATSRVLLAQLWVAILILGQLRSPFLPWSYGNIAIVWLLALLLPVSGLRWWAVLFIALGWAVATVHIPVPFGPSSGSFDLVYGLVSLLAVLTVCLTIVLRRPRTTPHVA